MDNYYWIVWKITSPVRIIDFGCGYGYLGTNSSIIDELILYYRGENYVYPPKGAYISGYFAH
ncbi:SAM-dependent methyltransferase [Paenibacillus sp. J2TS4]|uniref:SAM-dependent methyltransferase n=1 Tax=Paenibacillus sp. J2TS4 TaxID=2807194 RepID=UPI001B015CF8|nr:SAM-dependent methyltransferase [Paenibacillus sp. J2TS4]GIP33987.1 hypothetical protein J2TS4_31970 [Paenibacillus sp. J2TS4]